MWRLSESQKTERPIARKAGGFGRLGDRRRIPACESSMQEGVHVDDGYEDINLPNGTRRRVFTDGRVITLKAPTRAEREHHAKQRRAEIRNRHSDRLVPSNAPPDNVVELHRRKIYRWGERPPPQPRPVFGVAADVVPLGREFVQRDLAAHEILRADDEVVQADGTWAPIPGKLVGRSAGGHRHIRRAIRLAEGRHRLLDVGEIVVIGDAWWDDTRWRPCCRSLGHRVRHDRRNRRHIDYQLRLRADPRTEVASEIELAMELGPAGNGDDHR